jgi:hypothetical protein
VFTLRVSPTPDVTIDPATGIAKPAQTVEKTYRLDGEVVKKVLPGGTPARAGAPAKTARPKSEPEPRHAAARHKRKAS